MTSARPSQGGKWIHAIQYLYRNHRPGHDPAPTLLPTETGGSLHTVRMSNQPAGHGGIQGGAMEGDVRFDSSGRLETFDGTDWVPLQRVSDIDVPPIFRNVPLTQPSTPEEVDSTDNPAPS
jgi:hypothetical protein